MNIIRWMFTVMFGLLVIIVVVQNYEAFSTSVVFKLDLLFFKWESPAISLYLISVITFCVGVIFTGLYSMLERFRLKKEIRTLKKDVKEKERELTSLRNLPVTAEDMESDVHSQ